MTLQLTEGQQAGELGWRGQRPGEDLGKESSCVLIAYLFGHVDTEISIL